MDERRRYELYVVFQPDLDEEGVESRIDRVNSTITTNQGEIIEVARKGKRKLAYPINRHTHGIDVLYQANLVPTTVELMERQFNLSEDVIRYLFVRRDDLAKAARQATAAAARPAESEPTPASSESRTVDPTQQPQPMEEFAGVDQQATEPAPDEQPVEPATEAGTDTPAVTDSESPASTEQGEN